MWCVSYRFGSVYSDYYFFTREEAMADISAELADHPDLKYVMSYNDEFVERN